MFSFKVNDKEYKVKFGYGVLSRTNVLMKASSLAGMAENMQEVVGILPELLLVGLQKKHKDEFGYETENEEKAAYEKVCDLLDDYEDESTDENPKNGFDLFQKISKELEKNGFLSGLIKETEKMEAEEKQGITKIPQDHKKKS